MRRVAFLVLVVVLAVTSYWYHYCRLMRFSSSAWKTNSHRLQMVGDLIASEILIGKDEAELQEMLGDSKMWYYVGSEWSEFPFSNVLLYVEMKDGKIVNVYRHNKF